ncbi:MltA domain-containing protein [Enterovirga sp.]|uniref:murein transglycosylase A n=1 Tax=Enterovirga sp. TaxID=2026350 RepID=UPI002A6490CE|nr:lytic murein transglycosylase [Enterovirga sp.]
MDARQFFERFFEPVDVIDRGFLTGYYEPELAGSLTPEGGFRTPLLGRPAGFVGKGSGPTPPGWPPGMTAARRTASGLQAFPDRAAIEGGALGEAARPIVYLADPVDAFMVHIQGSARVRLGDGRLLRVGFDGRNGHPYTPVARVLADQEGTPRAEMTADRLVAWLKAHPDRAPAVMQANRSYIFFRATEVASEAGPIGAAGVPLTTGRSLAVDPSHASYGTPIWLDGSIPAPGGATEPLRRLVVAQDTGAAITGRGRGDLFFGSGAEAGARASLVRHPVRWVVLRPKRPDRPGPRP